MFRNCSSIFTLILVLLSIFMFITVWSFPQGAPPEVCELLSPKRGHKVLSQPLQRSPFRLIQHGRHYRPGQIVAVELLPKIEDASFKGFIVQAFDADTFEFIGHFLPGDGLKLMPECSAVTHQNPELKSSASFIWVAPNGRKGEVIFRTTVVVNKEEYYENIIADVSQPANNPFDERTIQN